MAADEFLFVGNHAWLDFVNTEVISSGERVDLLGDFAALVRWLRAAGFVDDEQASRLLVRWDGKAGGQRALARAREFRAVLRRLAERLASGGRPQSSAVDAINALLRHRVAFSRVVVIGGSIERVAHWEFDEPEQLLAPIADSAAGLLATGDRSLVRKCKNPTCILFFYDTSKNHSRNWCSMSACGNRTKVAAHYHRRRDASR